jgi:hypothetical protein
MKRKAIKAELRKESKTFPGYYKYELDIQEEDGSITKAVPAYGKDLQDALQRTVKHNKIEKVERVFSNLPYWVMIVVFMIYMTALSITSLKSGEMWPLITGVVSMVVIILGVQYLTTEKEIKD